MVSESDFALGTTCRVQLYSTSQEKFLQPALDLAKEVEEIMSVNIPDSEISRINHAAGEDAVSVSEGTWRLLKRGQEFSRMSGGIFDITVGPLVDLWAIGTGEERVPGDQELEEVLELVDYRDLELTIEGRQARLARRGMSIDLGGIAKGYAADIMVEYLNGEGVDFGIINLGGNVYAFGEKYGEDPWKIGIQSPYEERGKYIGIVEVRNKAVVTSGKYERYFMDDGVRYHHILSTADGYPIENGVASVSVVSEDATAADALSTLLFGLGLEEGLRRAEAMEGVEAIIIDEEHTVYTTSGLRDTFSLTDEDFKRGESRIILEN